MVKKNEKASEVSLKSYGSLKKKKRILKGYQSCIEALIKKRVGSSAFRSIKWSKGQNIRL